VETVETSQRAKKAVAISRRAAGKLSYYTSAQGFGVFAPRGWHCLGLNGSSGYSLFVAPQRIEATDLSSLNNKVSDGPAVTVLRRFGDSSGRVQGAQVIARVFPAYQDFIDHLKTLFDVPATWFSYGPYATDRLTYKGNRIVEYETPAHTDGLGTQFSMLSKSDGPINGVVMLIGTTPDLVFLSMRLPADLFELRAAIIFQTSSSMPLDRARASRADMRFTCLQILSCRSD